MKLTSCIKLSLAFIINTSIISIFGVTSTAHAQNQEQVLIENILQQAYNLPLRIDHIAEQFAMLVSKNQIRNLKNKSNILQYLREIRILMTSTLSEQVQVATINDLGLQKQIINAILMLSNAVTEHLSDATKKHLRTLNQFDINTLTHRSAPTNISIEQLINQLGQVSKKLEKLEKKSEFVGLTWYNITTRTLEKYVIDPCKKYQVPAITKAIGLTTLTALLVTWKFGSVYTKGLETNHFREETVPNYDTEKFKTFVKSQKNPLIKYLYNLFDTIGHPYSYSVSQDQTEMFDPKRKYSLLSTVDDFFTKTLSNSFPQVTMLTGLTYATYTSAWKDKLQPWLEKKGNSIWNFLRGGSYEQKSVSGVWDFDPTVTFDDVVGLDEVKEELSFIIKFIDNPEQYLRVHTAPEKGWLLTGPTRTGKSFIVEALCGEIHQLLEKRGRKDEFKFWKVDSSIFTQFSISDVLETAKDNAPIVLFIDEIDLLGLQRVGNNQMLQQFLTSMGTTLDTDPRKQVILIAATNKPQTLDKALRQYGRLGKEIRFEYPAYQYRLKYLERELNNMALDLNQFDLVSIAQKTEGKSFEDLRAIIRTALIRSWSRGEQLNQALLEESLDTEIRHIITSDRKELSDIERNMLSIHFAGKALTMLLLDTHAQLDKVTIKAVMTDLKEETQWDEFMKQDDKDEQKKIVHGRIFTKYLHDTINLHTREQTINEIKTLLAGSIAEEIILGATSYSCHPESCDQAFKLTESLVFEGLNPTKLSKRLRRELSDKAYKMFVELKKEVTSLLNKHKDDLTILAKELAERNTLSAEQIVGILNQETPKENQENSVEIEAAA